VIEQACWMRHLNRLDGDDLMKRVTELDSNVRPLLTMTAKNADEILDHLSTIIRVIDSGAGRIERIHGMGLQYWTDRINAVIDDTARFPAQQERAKRLLIRLRSADRA
jgi:hypothetical protein